MSDENTTDGNDETKNEVDPQVVDKTIKKDDDASDTKPSLNLANSPLKIVERIEKTKIQKLADDIKAGDDSLNKLKIQNLDFILDIPLNVTVELGRTHMRVRELLQLGQGSVIELNKTSGEPLEVLVNNKLVARGEVVVVNEKFGIKITEIISPIERIETLK